MSYVFTLPEQPEIFASSSFSSAAKCHNIHISYITCVTWVQSLRAPFKLPVTSLGYTTPPWSLPTKPLPHLWHSFLGGTLHSQHYHSLISNEELWPFMDPFLSLCFFFSFFSFHLSFPSFLFFLSFCLSFFFFFAALFLKDELT